MPNDTGNKVRHPHRTYSLAFKQQVIKETLEPGTSVSVVARRHDINANVVFEWRNQYRAGKLTLPELAVAEEPSPASTSVRRADGTAASR
jgi:transposase